MCKIQETVAANVEGIANITDKVDQAIIQIGKTQESVHQLKYSGNEPQEVRQANHELVSKVPSEINCSVKLD